MYKTILILIITVLLAACNGLHPYRVDIQQGNIIDATTKAQLHLGMDKEEVKSLLGTPVFENMFNENTWVYVSTKQKNGGKITEEKLILEFKNNKLVQIK